MTAKTLFLALALSAGFLWAQQEKKEAPPPAAPPATAAPAAPAVPHPATISAEDKARKNPIKFTEVSVDRGKKIYATQCALCHGDKGDGKTDLATDMKLQLPDLSKPGALKNRTDGELFSIITTGQDPMPSQSGRLTETHRWNLVNYLRALGGGVPAKSTGNEPEENVILVPQK